jgi:hypothetical protein
MARTWDLLRLATLGIAFFLTVPRAPRQSR